MRKKCISLLLLIFLLLSSIINVQAKTTNDTIANTNNIKDYIRGYHIDFDPPELLLEGGSFFDLNITLTKFRLRPNIFSVSVFLNVTDIFGRNSISRIGLLPLVHIPMFHQEPYTITVPCITLHNFSQYLECINNGMGDTFKIKKAAIGVRIDRISRWGFNG